MQYNTEMSNWTNTVPKAVLHDHLDGGLRVATLLELSQQQNYNNLPTNDEESLLKWIQPKPDMSLALNLEAWDHTIAVMQDENSLYRVTMEALEDLANDGVVYSELRFAPLVHCQKELTPTQVVNAVLNGIKDGEHKYNILAGVILCSMRHLSDSKKVVKLCIENKDVLAFDLAGPEIGFSSLNHRDALELAHNNNIKLTIHADWEVPKGIHEVVLEVKSNRIGHGSQIVNDFEYHNDRIVFKNDAAKYVYDNQIALELCPTSNMQCGSCKSIAEHPFKKLYDTGFNVTINTDNRLMSNTSMSREVLNLVDAFDFTEDQIRKITYNTVKAGFIDEKKKSKLLNIL